METSVTTQYTDRKALPKARIIVCISTSEILVSAPLDSSWTLFFWGEFFLSFIHRCCIHCGERNTISEQIMKLFHLTDGIKGIVVRFVENEIVQIFVLLVFYETFSVAETTCVFVYSIRCPFQINPFQCYSVSKMQIILILQDLKWKSQVRWECCNSYGVCLGFV